MNPNYTVQEIFDLADAYDKRIVLSHEEARRVTERLEASVQTFLQKWSEQIPKDIADSYGMRVIQLKLYIQTGQFKLNAIYPTLKEIQVKYSLPSSSRDLLLTITMTQIIAVDSTYPRKEMVFVNQWEPVTPQFYTCTTRDAKIQIYKDFLHSPTMTWIVVLGEAGTGKSAALKEAGTYPSKLILMSEGEDTQILEPEDGIGAMQPIKHIIHRHTYDDVARVPHMTQKEKCLIVKFQESYVSITQELEQEFRKWIRDAPADQRYGNTILAELCSLREEYIEVCHITSTSNKLYFTCGPTKRSEYVLFTNSTIVDSRGRQWSR